MRVFVFLFLLVSFQVQGQSVNYLSVNDSIRALALLKKDTLRFEEIIQLDQLREGHIYLNNKFIQVGNMLETKDSTKIRNSIRFESCTFSSISWFRLIEFEKKVVFAYCKFPDGHGSFIFRNTVFKSEFEFIENSFSQVGLNDCKFNNRVVIVGWGIQTFGIHGSEFSFNDSIEFKEIFELDSLEMLGMRDDGFQNEFHKLNPEPLWPIWEIHGFRESNLYFSENSFRGPANTCLLLGDAIPDEFHFKKNDFGNLTLVLKGLEISKRVEFIENRGIKNLGFFNMILPELSNNIIFPYSQIEGRKLFLAMPVYANESPSGWGKVWFFKGQKISEYQNVFFEQFINTYYNLYKTYKERGDIKSANSAYVDIKNTQIGELKYIFEEEGTFKSFFRLKLAQLLKTYTNHGTDPALAIVISMYVIFAFAVFYFFFPSEWDVTSKSKLLQNYRDFVQKNDKGYAKPFLMMVLGFGVSLINALTLSLNSFTTLGFGKIPTQGLARYVCIIQGFIGWFLLSIFTVALINQVLA